jgi:hypothetical protein
MVVLAQIQRMTDVLVLTNIAVRVLQDSLTVFVRMTSLHSTFPCVQCLLAEIAMSMSTSVSVAPAKMEPRAHSLLERRTRSHAHASLGSPAAALAVRAVLT